MKRTGSPPRRQRGSVLIIVLWIALGLVAITLYFANAMSSELRASDNRVSALVADQAIEGAARYVASVLTEQATNGFVPYVTDYANEAVLVGNAHFWLIGRDPGHGTPNQIAFGLVDEGSKLNLNNTNVNAAMLELLPRMTPALAAAIVDWRDADSTITANGAESETYGRLRPPYLCKNAPFDSVDELRLVAGAEMDLLLGEDVNRNGILDPNEIDENRDGVANPGLLEYVTVYSREPNTRSDGSPRIRISDRAQLQLLLTQAFNAARANQVSNRLAGPLPSPRSPLEFYLRSGLTAEEFAQIETEITTASGPIIEGRVNVNTASVAVLACLVGDDKAQQLVDYRLANTVSGDSVAWVTKVLSRAEAIQAGPMLTGQSYQFSADIAALGPFGRGYRRTRFVFDLSEGAPKIIYRQNLGHLGWALGRETRQTWLAKSTP